MDIVMVGAFIAFILAAAFWPLFDDKEAR